MRTNIEIDDELMRTAMKVSGLKTKRAAVEEALRLMIRMKRQKDVAKLFGKVKWQGNLEESRRARFVDDRR